MGLHPAQDRILSPRKLIPARLVLEILDHFLSAGLPIGYQRVDLFICDGV
jgi:hypothetical protein